MNILNLKRQVSGFMLMCGGGASDSGGSSGGNPEDGSGYSSGSSFTDEGGMTVDNSDHNRFSGQEGESQPTSPASSGNVETPVSGGDIKSGGDYSGYTTGTGYTDGDSSNASPYAKEMTDTEKSGRAIVGKAPILGQMLSTVESIGKFIQPSGSLLKRGETGMPSAQGFKDNSLDEDGVPIVKKPIGLINTAAQVAPEVTEPAQQTYEAPQAATPTNAVGVNASMYGSGSGWGSSIAKFTTAQQGTTS